MFDKNPNDSDDENRHFKQLHIAIELQFFSGWGFANVQSFMNWISKKLHVN